jgi:hypothetical protein
VSSGDRGRTRRAAAVGGRVALGFGIGAALRSLSRGSLSRGSLSRSNRNRRHGGSTVAAADLPGLPERLSAGGLRPGQDAVVTLPGDVDLRDQPRSDDLPRRDQAEGADAFARLRRGVGGGAHDEQALTRLRRGVGESSQTADR